MRFICRPWMFAASLLLSACGGGSAPAPAPTVSMSVSTTSIDAGDSATLTWTSAYATSCTASGGWSGTLATSGTQSTGVLTANAVFYLTCSGPGGTTAPVMAAVTVYPRPTVSLAATPTAVASGASSTLKWTSSNAGSCSASGAWSGTLAANGSQSTGPISAPQQYSIVCTGQGGASAPATAAVALIPAY